jgi:hypothetical protein
MSSYFEIAYAAASNRLCFLTGTGFSKAVTANAAPSWKSLLETLCQSLPNADKLKAALFPTVLSSFLPLEEAAQILDIELQKVGKSAHLEIASLIRELSLVGDTKPITAFIEENTFSIKVVTTNYDKLFQQLAAKVTPQTVTPGLPIPRSPAKVRVYHVHGSIDSPKNMVVTSDDYFKFLNSDSYFSKKLSTILHENTVVILGYSLGDTNLKSILSDYKVFCRANGISGNIFFVSRSAVDQHIKDYYAHSFSIRVIDGIDILDFFSKVNSTLPEAVDNLVSSQENTKKVLYENKKFTDDYLKIEASFFHIVASISALGLRISDPDVVKLIGVIIEKKIEFTKENGAWTQYTQLAKWLTYLATLIELKNTPIEQMFLDAVAHSMKKMSRLQVWGYSWHAYRTWSTHWADISPDNRSLIHNHIRTCCSDEDVLELVNSL